MGSPMTALRVLLGWLVVIGIAVYAVQHPQQVMQAVADVIEGIANWIAQQTGR
jgi:hypothetical protein